MTTAPAILLVDSDASDRDLAVCLLHDRLPRTSIVVAADPLAFADALQHAPPVAIVSADLAWASAADLIRRIKHRSPHTAVVLFGTHARTSPQFLHGGLALDGIVPKNSDGYLALASVIADALERSRQPAEATNSSGPIHAGPVDRMIGSPGISASDDGALLLRFPPAGGDRLAGRAPATSSGLSRPHTSLVMESPSMPDGPTSFEMRGSESQPVPVENLSPAIHEAPAVPVREGLPSTFRMRADAHYVESLDMAPPAPKLQLVDVSRIDPRDAGRIQPAPALVASIRSVGVLQPLIAEPRNGRFRLLAGDKRLAAARAAGLRDVPCIVRRTDDANATEVAAAANLFVADDKVRTPQVAEPDAASADAARELTRALSSLAVSLPLLEQPASNLARAAAMNVAKAELWRATWLAEAAAVLRGELPLGRRRVPVERLVTRVLESVQPERRVRGIALHRQISLAQSEVAGDEDRLVAALSATVIATMEVVEGDDAAVHVTARMHRDESLVFSVAQSSAGVPPAWRSRASDDAPAGAAGAGAVALTAARRIVEASEGRLTIDAVEYGSEIQIVLPRVS